LVTSEPWSPRSVSDRSEAGVAVPTGETAMGDRSNANPPAVESTSSSTSSFSEKKPSFSRAENEPFTTSSVVNAFVSSAFVS